MQYNYPPKAFKCCWYLQPTALKSSGFLPAASLLVHSLLLPHNTSPVSFLASHHHSSWAPPSSSSSTSSACPSGLWCHTRRQSSHSHRAWHSLRFPIHPLLLLQSPFVSSPLKCVIEIKPERQPDLRDSNLGSYCIKHVCGWCRWSYLFLSRALKSRSPASSSASPLELKEKRFRGNNVVMFLNLCNTGEKNSIRKCSFIIKHPLLFHITQSYKYTAKLQDNYKPNKDNMSEYKSTQRSSNELVAVVKAYPFFFILCSMQK